MKPYFERDGVVLYHGDTLHVLDALGLEGQVAAFVTDPPYASGARHEAQKASSGAMVRGARWNAKPIENDQMTTTGFLWLMRHICYAARDMLVDGGAFLSFIDWRQWPNLVGAVETTNLRVNQMVVWDKKAMGLGNGFRAQHELILYASKGTPRVINRGVPNVLAFARDDNSDHPSPKPVALMERLLDVVSEPGDLIIDPFGGGGATALAAWNKRRRAILIEVEERHCETSARRLSSGLLPTG